MCSSDLRDEDCINAMMADFLEREDSRALAINRLLEDLADRLQESGRNLSDYGLPEPDNLASELSRELLRFDPEEQRNWIQQQRARRQNNRLCWTQSCMPTNTRNACCYSCRAKVIRRELNYF